MRAVKLDRVEADPPRVAGRLAKGGDHVADIGVGQRLDDRRLVDPADAGGAVDGAGIPGLAWALHRAHVPELRRHHPAGRVHRVDDLLPDLQRFAAPEVRHLGIVGRRRPLDHRAFGHDQTDLRGGSAGVVVDHSLGRSAVRGLRARHGGHDDAVLELERLQPERLEQGVQGHR